MGKSFSQKTSDDFRITPYERMVIQGLRENPEMRVAIDRLLRIEIVKEDRNEGGGSV
jgi:hypothetical protein